MKKLHIDGVAVDWFETSRGIMEMGVDVHGRRCPVAEHTLRPEWVKEIKDGAKLKTGGHEYEMKTPEPEKPHPKFYSLD